MNGVLLQADILGRLAEPFQHGFMVQALWIAVLVGVACAALSCFVVLKGWSLMGDAVSHAVLPGVALAYVAGLPLAAGAFASGLGCVMASGWLKGSTRLKPDTAMGVVFTGLFGAGLVMVSRIQSEIHLKHILFGNLLGVEKDDVVQVVVAAGMALAVLAVWGRDIRLVCFDEAHARAIGLRTGLLHTALLAVLAMTIVASMQAVGIILVVAMLITPGAIGVLLCDRFSAMLMTALGASVLACVGGTYLSYFIDGATGACIVLVLAGLFLAAMVLAPKHGILARKRAAAPDAATGGAGTGIP